MTSSIFSTTVDCADAGALAMFWASVLGREVDPEASPFFASIGRAAPDGQTAMMFIQVPEGKTVKNRMHLDLQADDRAAEVERVVSLGATFHSEHDEYDTRWTTLTDPEGNEFCIAAH
jgi:predicted enzyme related to lactoylglutathione lyase